MNLLGQWKKYVVVPENSTIRDASSKSYLKNSVSESIIGINRHKPPSSNGDSDLLDRQYIEVHHAKEEKKELEAKKHRYSPKMMDAFAQIMTCVLYGQFYGWNYGLEAGFGSYFIAQVLVGFAYICFAFCLAEMISTTSFSGGAYGMARIALGFYPGFVVASFEFMEYITYMAYSVLLTSDFFCANYGWDIKYIPLIGFINYVIIGLILCEQNYVFWRLNYLCAIMTVGVLLVFCFGSLKYMNFHDNAPLKYTPTDDYYYGAGMPYIPAANSSSNATISTSPNYFTLQNRSAWFSGGFLLFYKMMPPCMYGFAGVESCALITDMIDNPRVNLSYALAAGGVFLFLCMMFVMFCCVSLPGGINTIMHNPFFMTITFEKLGMSTFQANWFMILGNLSMGFGFGIPSFKLLHAIACSHLTPRFLNLQHASHIPAIIGAMIGSFLIFILANERRDMNLAMVGTLFALFTYSSDLAAYYKMKTDFSTRDHKFTNPFGLYGAGYAAVIFLFTMVSLIFFQEDDHLAIKGVLMFLAFLTVYYFTYAQRYQQFSDDEQKTLLVLHVMENNKRKRKFRMPKFIVSFASRMRMSGSAGGNKKASQGNRSGGGGGGGGNSGSRLSMLSGERSRNSRDNRSASHLAADSRHDPLGGGTSHFANVTQSRVVVDMPSRGNSILQSNGQDYEADVMKSTFELPTATHQEDGEFTDIQSPQIESRKHVQPSDNLDHHTSNEAG